jgi:ABC-type sugar transport system substrate-binding protein
MKKTIVAITAAAFLGGAATTLTPAPAHAVYPIFLLLTKQPDPNFKSVNPYAKKESKKAKKKKM